MGACIGATVGYIGSTLYKSTHSIESAANDVQLFWIASCAAIFVVIEFLTKGELIRSLLATAWGIFGFESGMFQYDNRELPTFVVYLAGLAIAMIWGLAFILYPSQ